MAWPALGAACRIGSTPLTNVIAVPALEGVPSVERITTASPLWRSVNETAGARLMSRCKSGPPPERGPGAFPPEAPGTPEGRGFWSIVADAELEDAPDMAAAVIPFKRFAIIWAISGGRLRN